MLAIARAPMSAPIGIIITISARPPARHYGARHFVVMIGGIMIGKGRASGDQLGE